MSACFMGFEFSLSMWSAFSARYSCVFPLAKNMHGVRLTGDPTLTIGVMVNVCMTDWRTVQDVPSWDGLQTSWPRQTPQLGKWKKMERWLNIWTVNNSSALFDSLLVTKMDAPPCVSRLVTSLESSGHLRSYDCCFYRGGQALTCTGMVTETNIMLIILLFGKSPQARVHLFGHYLLIHAWLSCRSDSEASRLNNPQLKIRTAVEANLFKTLTR